MELKPGYLYTLSADYFTDVKDPNVMRGKDSEGNDYSHKRPHLCAFIDKATNVAWFIPCSHENISKHEKRATERTNAGLRNNAVDVCEINSVKQVLLLRSIVPVAKNYVEQEFKPSGTHHGITDDSTFKKIHSNAKNARARNIKGIYLSKFPIDIKKIEQQMVDTLQREKEGVQSMNEEKNIMPFSVYEHESGSLNLFVQDAERENVNYAHDYSEHPKDIIPAIQAVQDGDDAKTWAGHDATLAETFNAGMPENSVLIANNEGAYLESMQEPAREAFGLTLNDFVDFRTQINAAPENVNFEKLQELAQKFAGITHDEFYERAEDLAQEQHVVSWEDYFEFATHMESPKMDAFRAQSLAQQLDGQGENSRTQVLISDRENILEAASLVIIDHDWLVENGVKYADGIETLNSGIYDSFDGMGAAFDADPIAFVENMESIKEHNKLAREVRENEINPLPLPEKPEEFQETSQDIATHEAKEAPREKDEFDLAMGAYYDDALEGVNPVLAAEALGMTVDEFTAEYEKRYEAPASTLSADTITANDFIATYRESLYQSYGEIATHGSVEHTGVDASRYWNQIDALSTEIYSHLPAVEFLGIAPQSGYDADLPQNFQNDYIRPDVLSELASLLEMDMAKMLRMQPNELDALMKTTEISHEALDAARSFGQQDGEDIAKHENKEMASEAELATPSHEEPTSSQVETKLDEPSVLFEKSPEITELLQVLKENGKTEQATAIAALIDHVKTMESTVKSCSSTIAEMKNQLDTVQEIQKHPVKNLLEKAVNGLQNEARHVKGLCAKAKNDIIDACKNILDATKDMGIEALDKIADFFHVREHYEKIEAKSENAIKRCEKAVERIEMFSQETNKAENALKNLGRLVLGKEPVDKPAEMGKLAKAMSAPFNNSKELHTKIRDNATESIKALDRLSEHAETIQEKRVERPSEQTREAAPPKKESWADVKTRNTEKAQNQASQPDQSRKNTRDERS